MNFNIRGMEKADWPEVGELIYVSINYWYHTHGSGPKFNNGPESTTKTLIQVAVFSL
ncbi:MAG: hypothetical protein VXB01_13375 [Opitutae bacterium]